MTTAALRGRAWGLVALAALATAGAAALPPVPQPAAYHLFADDRRLLGVPNALNVLSNAGFLLVGAAGLALVARARRRREPGDPLAHGWDVAAATILCAGVLLTALGSAWYHLHPTNATLVWDRLPMTLVFVTLLALVIDDRVSRRAARTLLPPLLLAGLASVVYWGVFDDLRPYGLVQFVPLTLVPIMLVAFPSRTLGGPGLAVAAGLYVVGKIAEMADGAIFATGGIVSGHTLKHLAAAAGGAALVHWLVSRRETRVNAGVALPVGRHEDGGTGGR